MAATAPGEPRHSASQPCASRRADSLRSMVRQQAFDTRRGIAFPRPVLRGVSHQVMFDLSLVAGTWLVVSAEEALARLVAAVYAVIVSGLFGASALYHRLAWRPAALRRLQRLDAAMIFVMIAGTYTPVLVLAAPPTIGLVLLTAVWVLALLGVLMRLVWLDAPERLVGATYVGLGWLSIPVLPLVWTRLGLAGIGLIVAGGVLYTIGALGYHHRWPDPRPEVFGFHEVFHVYVCAAAACHYVAIAVFVL